ncbi:MAG: extracellular solute-binding protein family 1 [Caproiciproducens sp.]|nr:extracellular solute-binding protein family 1 [Caproiciproducens sp.]
MRMIRKVLALMLTICMVSINMAGCQGQSSPSSAGTAAPVVSSENSPKKPVTITIWHEAAAEIAKSLQTELNKLAPNVVVKLERKEKLADALKLVGNDPSSAPDMYFYAHDKLGTFAQMGILSPVTDFISKDDMQDLLPMTVNAATFNSQIYQLPVYFETQMFMYNKKLMKDPPKTTDDLLKYMKENTKGGVYGFVEQHSTAYYASAWMHAYGAAIINDQKEPGLNSQQMISALTYHKQFVPYEPKDGEYNTITALFKEGKAHAIIGGPWLVPEVKAANIDLGIAQMPTVSATGKPLTPYSGVQGVCVLKTAEDKKDAVAAVLKQLLKADIGISLAKTANCAPANAKCYDNAEVNGNEMLKAMKETAENVVPMPNFPEMDVMWTATENMLVAINKNNADIKTECDKAQKEALSQLEAMK